MGAFSSLQVAKSQRSQAVAQTYVLPPPSGGLNARDALAAMPETDALILDNLYPQPTYVEIRGGKAILATFTGQPLTLMAYNALGAGVQQMFAAVKNGSTYSIYRVDNAGGGAVGAAVVGGGGATVQALTSAAFDFNQFGTGAAEVLYALNGTDAPLFYDGSTWVAVSAVSTPALTSGPSPLSTLSQVAVYQKRLWFVQGGTFNVYYLPQNVYGGALTLLNMAPNFKLGGYLAALITISIDDASGSQDYIAFLSTQGEFVMYQGYDPASVSTWSIAGHGRIGAPIGTGRNCWQKIGFDAMVMCQDGFAMLSESLLTDRSQQKNLLSDKVRLGINQAIGLYGKNPGWQALLYPAGNKLFFTIPTASNQATSFNYVMNTLNGSWCTWGQISSPLNMSCMENFNNQFYFGATGAIYQGDNGLSDAGSPITWTAKQAYSYMDSKIRQKRWTMAQPFFQTSGALAVAITLSSDFDTTFPTGPVPLSIVAGAVWNVGMWNSTFWGDAQQIVRNWVGLSGVGFAGSILMQASTQNLSMKWQSTMVMYEEGGTFYGK